MDIAILAATELELKGLRELLADFSKGNIIFHVTGVGIISTTLSVEKLIQTHHPDLLIQIGIAGTFNNQFAIGSAVAIDAEISADMGVFENGVYRDIFDMGLADSDAYPYTAKKLVNPHENLLSASKLKTAHAVSVNEISTDENKINLFVKQYNAEIESMEGAAFHQTCLVNKIPFIQLRGISNKVGERDKSKWDIPAALKAVHLACQQLIISMNA